MLLQPGESLGSYSYRSPREWGLHQLLSPAWGRHMQATLGQPPAAEIHGVGGDGCPTSVRGQGQAWA